MRFLHCYLLMGVCLSLTTFVQAADQGGAIPLPHSGAVPSCAFSPDGRSLVTACSDKIIRVWDVATGKEINRITGSPGEVLCVAVSVDGKRIASVGTNDNNAVRMWDAGTGKPVWTMQSHTQQPNAVAIAPDGKMLVSVGSERRTSVANAENGQLMRVHMSHTAAVLCVAVSPDGQTIATGGKDRMMNVWQMNTGQQLFRGIAHTGDVTAVAFSPDGKYLATAGDDKIIKLWEPATGKEIRSFTGHTDRVRSIAFASDSKTLISGSQDQTIGVWDVNSGKSVRTVRRHRGPVSSVAFSKDGRLVASASDEGTVIVSSLAGLQNQKLEPIDLTAKQLDQLWVDLVEDDSRSVQAMWTMVAGGKHAVPFLQEHLKKAATPVVPEQVAQLLRDLDADNFAEREKASRALEKMGKKVEDALRRELQQTTSAEVRRRIDELLEKLGPKAALSPEQKRLGRAVDVLEQVANPEAKEVLEKLAKGDAGPELTQLAKAALDRLAKRTATP